MSHADSGAIYGGRDLSSRGVKMLNNYFHHINHLSLCNAETSCIRAAIYVDDFQGGVTVSGNIFYKVFTSFFSNQGRWVDRILCGLAQLQFKKRTTDPNEIASCFLFF